MQSLYDFIIKPIGKRYNNTKKIGDKELIVNTEVFNHQYTNREAEVISIPRLVKTDIKPGDTVIVHHNIFRRWHDARGVEKNSSNFVDETTYKITLDQIFLYKSNNYWQAPDEYCFVKPIHSYNTLDVDTEQPLVGILKYSNKLLDESGLTEGDLIGFTPSSEYEFIIERERLYRVYTSEITIKYEYQGQEKEYNPSWVQSG